MIFRENDRTRVPPGSAVKPLVSVALLESRAATPFPCTGSLQIAGRSFACSHPRVAGSLDLPAALAYSCNEYFAAASRRVRPAVLAGTLRRLGLEARVPASADGAALLALGMEGVTCTAAELAQAYRRLAALRLRPVVEGLLEAATSGTARLAAPKGVEVCGKTGTSGRAAVFGGWAPAAAPRLVVAVMVPGGRGGTDAAPVARELFERFL
jgi:cell division protein FtsI/penicillin-binding protein 2